MRIDKKSGDYILDNGALWSKYAYNDFFEIFEITPESFYNMSEDTIKNKTMTWEASKDNMIVKWERI
jgi:hypothetical protein